MNYTIVEINVREKTDNNEPHCYVDSVRQYENGVIQVFYESTNDAFFASVNAYSPCGDDVVDSICETEKTGEVSAEDLALAICRSAREHGIDTIPREVFQLF